MDENTDQTEVLLVDLKKLEDSIYNTYLPTRVRNALKRSGVTTIGDLVKRFQQLPKGRFILLTEGLGVIGYQEIERYLTRNGLLSAVKRVQASPNSLKPNILRITVKPGDEIIMSYPTQSVTISNSCISVISMDPIQITVVKDEQIAHVGQLKIKSNTKVVFST